MGIKHIRGFLMIVKKVYIIPDFTNKTIKNNEKMY